jgi:hypothetical protein
VRLQLSLVEIPERRLALARTLGEEANLLVPETMLQGGEQCERGDRERRGGGRHERGDEPRA